MEEKKIETIKTWLNLQSIWDIQVFLGFANFYKRFIQNFNRIAVPLTSKFKTTLLNSGTETNEMARDTTTDIVDEIIDGADGKIENLLIGVNAAKFKKSNLAKSKKQNFAKANSPKIDFLTLKAKKAFIHL